MGASSIDKYLDLYYDKFGKDFPLMQAPSNDEAIKHIDECIKYNQDASKRFPDLYGSVEGKII